MPLVLCVRPHDQTPQQQNFLSIKIQQETHQNLQLFPSFSLLLRKPLTYSHNSELPSWESKPQSYYCNDPDFQVNLDLYQCNELQQVKEDIHKVK